MSATGPIDLFEALLAGVRDKIDEELHRHRHRRPFILLLQPIFTNRATGELVMADIPLALNQTYTGVITLLNPTTGKFDPVSPSDVFTAVPSDTTNAEVSVAPFVPPANATAAQQALAGIPAVTFGWLHNVTPPLTGIVVTISDSAGNEVDKNLSFAMTPAVTVPDQIGIDTNDAVLTTVATPV